MKDHLTLVENILRAHPVTRDDDFRLYVWACFMIKPELMHMKFEQAMWFHDENGLPSYESITRARRKLQEQIPELRGKKYKERQARQEEYINKYGRKYT